MGPKKKGRRYPWDRWFDQDSFRLIRGVDYTMLSESMYKLIRESAKKRGVTVSVTNGPNGDSMLVIVTGRKDAASKD